MTKLHDVEAGRPPTCAGCHLPLEEGNKLAHCLNEACDELVCGACWPSTPGRCPICQNADARVRRGVYLFGTVIRWRTTQAGPEQMER